MADRTRERLAAYRRFVTADDTVRCAYCGLSVSHNSFDLHEAIVKRSSVPTDKQDLILVRQNMIPIHHNCHMEYGNTSDMAVLCIVHMAQRISACAMANWYRALIDEHEMSVARGMMISPKAVKPYRYASLIASGAYVKRISVRLDADWEFDSDGRTYDFLAVAGLRWAKKRVRAKPPKTMNGLSLDNAVSCVSEGYCLGYLVGMFGSDSTDACARHSLVHCTK